MRQSDRDAEVIKNHLDGCFEKMRPVNKTPYLLYKQGVVYGIKLTW